MLLQPPGPDSDVIRDPALDALCLFPAVHSLKFRSVFSKYADEEDYKNLKLKTPSRLYQSSSSISPEFLSDVDRLGRLISDSSGPGFRLVDGTVPTASMWLRLLQGFLGELQDGTCRNTSKFVLEHLLISDSNDTICLEEAKSYYRELVKNQKSESSTIKEAKRLTLDSFLQSKPGPDSIRQLQSFFSSEERRERSHSKEFQKRKAKVLFDDLYSTFVDQNLKTGAYDSCPDLCAESLNSLAAQFLRESESFIDNEHQRTALLTSFLLDTNITHLQKTLESV